MVPVLEGVREALRREWAWATAGAGFGLSSKHKETNAMSNHGTDNVADFLRQIEETRKTFGATGRFPEGKLHASDEGEIRFGIAHKDGQVLLNFGKPVAWMAVSAEGARELGELLIKHANEITTRAAFEDPAK
jgi:hypothetical protein